MTPQSLAAEVGRLPRLVTCGEYQQIPLHAEEVLSPTGELLIESAVVGKYVRIDFKGGAVRVSALGVSGLIPLNDQVAVQVIPRFPLRNLTHMVSVCGYSPTPLAALRTYAGKDNISEWLWDVLADSILDGLDIVRQQGLLRTYVRRYGTSSSPRGRIDTTGTMLRHASRNVQHRADYSWFERTVDTPENRCLKAAIVRLHARTLNRSASAGSRHRIARLAEAMRVLAEVADDRPDRILSEPTVVGSRPLPEARSYYRSILDLARSIVGDRGVDLDRTAREGSNVLPSLLVKTEDLFEDFVRLGLQQTFADDRHMKVMDGNRAPAMKTLYERLDPSTTEAASALAVMLTRHEGEAKPDLVCMRSDGTVPLVGDVKYTRVSEHAGRSELEQVLLYGVRYRSPVVLTVHPRMEGQASGLFVSGRIGDTLVAQYRLDLDAVNLDAEVIKMGDSLRGLMSLRA